MRATAGYPLASHADADLDTQARATAARYAVRFPDGHEVTRIRAALE